MSRFVFLENNYNETVRALKRCNNYLETQGRYHRVTLSLEDQLLYNSAISHIVVQLTGVLAWLMAWQAVEEGEISIPDLINGRYRLEEIETPTHERLSLFRNLPEPIPTLLNDGSQLYRRMLRIKQDYADFGRKDYTDSGRKDQAGPRLVLVKGE